MKLSGKVALVTGGGSGIGRATAAVLADNGAQVVVTGRRETSLRETCAQVAGGPAMRHLVMDVANRPAVGAGVAWVVNTFGAIHLVVHSAGVNVRQRGMAELASDDWDRVLRINATGAFNVFHAVLPQMRQQRDGLIINISSIAGLRASPLSGAAYSAAKHALNALGQTVAQEERENGIRVTNLCPGEVNTPLLDERPLPVSAEHRMRILQPEDVAAAVLFVASLPPHVHVPELVIKPTIQSFA